MRVQVKTGAKTIVEGEGATVQDVFRQIAQLQDVFGRVEKCGCCGNTELRYRVRQAKDFEFFCVECGNNECRARFSFGQPKNVKGGLFPQYKDKDGNWKENAGWEKYEANTNEHETHAQAAGYRR